MIGFGAVQFRTLVSMATDICHRVIKVQNVLIAFSQIVLIGSFLYLRVMMTYMYIRA